jgi:type I restriction enzyme, S subunit
MKAGWNSATIGDVCDVVNGGTPKTGIPEYWGGPHQWITPAEMGKRSTPYVSHTERTITDQGMQNSSARPLPPQSVILSSRAPIGHLVINTNSMATNQGCKGLVPRNQIDHKFLYYYLGSIVDLLNDLGTGATFKELSGGKLKEVFVPLPPLPEQQRIVSLLDETFDGIATARAHAERNLQNARAIFQSHLQSAIAKAFEFGETVALSDLATDISDGDHMPPPKSLRGVPFITIGNIAKDTRTIDFSDTFMVSRTYYDALKANKKPQIGDVLYTVTGSFGVPVLVTQSREFCFQRHIGLVRPKFQQANDGATGTAQKTVSLKVLRSYQVPRIPLSNQLETVAKLDSLFADTQHLESLYQRKLTALDELKKSLLHQAFSGQLTSAKQTGVSPQAALQTTTPEFTANIICLAQARHERQKREKTFGRVKEQKALHLVESIGRIDLGRHPMKDAAGPNDFQHMLKAEEWAKAHGFFEMVKRPDGGYDFKKLSAFDAHLSRARQALAPYLPQLESIIDLLVPMDTEEAEVFATVHAAWNNLLIDGLEVTDDAIVSAAREGWHADKLSIPKDKFRTAIALIRKKNLVPDGTTKYVGVQHQLL